MAVFLTFLCVKSYYMREESYNKKIALFERNTVNAQYYFIKRNTVIQQYYFVKRTNCKIPRKGAYE